MPGWGTSSRDASKPRKISEGSRVYLDTNILLTHFYTIDGEDPEDKISCRMLIKEIEKGKIVGIVSTLAVSELVDILKQDQILYLKRKLASEEIKDIESEIIAMLGKLGITPTEMDGQGPGSSAQSMMDRAMEFIMTTPGEFISHRKEDDAKTLGAIDALHAAMAERLGATHLISRDKSFRTLKCKVCCVILMAC